MKYILIFSAPNTSLQLLQNLSTAEPECERDTEEDMLLSTLFPQLFPSTTLANPSSQMNSIMGNDENNRVDGEKLME